MASAKGKQKVEARAPVPATPVPEGPARFYNRELSWLQFNRRVLEEAQNKQHPVLERLRFLSISASNLDEFYMVRAAGIYGQIAAGVATLTQDGLTPKQQLMEINRFAAKLVADKQACWNEIKKDMATAGIEIVEPAGLSSAEKTWLQRLFLSHIFPILTPIAVDPAHPFPFIPNLGLTMVVWMQRKKEVVEHLHMITRLDGNVILALRAPCFQRLAVGKNVDPFLLLSDKRKALEYRIAAKSGACQD